MDLKKALIKLIKDIDRPDVIIFLYHLVVNILDDINHPTF